jgi:hypothetical protein
MDIGERELSDIRNIAIRLLNSTNGSIYKPIERDLILLEALAEWLKRKGVVCEWRVKR